MISSINLILIIFILNHCYYDSVRASNQSEEDSEDESVNSNSIWDNVWKLSCDYVKNYLESSSTTSHIRAKRSPFYKDYDSIDFEDPEQLFNYLYPLAQVQLKDLIKESESRKQQNDESNGRSNKNNDSPFHLTLSTLISDLIEFWQTECELRHLEKNRSSEADDEDGDDDEKNDDDDFMEDDTEYVQAEDVEDKKENQPSSHTSARNGRARTTFNNHPEIIQRDMYSRETRNDSQPLRNLRFSSNTAPGVNQTPSMRSYFNSLRLETNGQSHLPDNNSRNSSSRSNVNRRRRRRKKTKKTPGNRNNIMNPRSDDDMTTTTAAPAAAKSDDNFFSAYGGDIEYFFPLLSFGIPFDGEITFLGFHGFKGIFPYKK